MEGGVCLSACWDTMPPDQAPPLDQIPLGPAPLDQAPPRSRPPGPGTPWDHTPLRSACWEIRSTSGRYASYWNAILLIGELTLTGVDCLPCKVVYHCYHIHQLRTRNDVQYLIILVNDN